MKFEPYPIQKLAINGASKWLREAAPGARKLYAAPTGFGKSVIELCLLEAFPELYLVTPRDEIMQGMFDKLEVESHPRIHTPIKLRNMLLRGEAQPYPAQLCIDEGHHQTEESKNFLDLLTGNAPMVAYTATPYRGSPKGTREFREFWGEPEWIITYREAIDAKMIQMPRMEVLPLVDDDIIEVTGGEFTIESIDSATLDRLQDLAEHSRQWHDGTKWTKPTIFAMPSKACCARMHQELSSRGLPCAIVAADTPREDRQVIFDLVVRGGLALLHINIVSEGVDLPIGRIVDAAPTMSPVKWVQQLGRAGRITANEPEYICTNRNILRHAYVLDGVVPVQAVVATEAAFGPTNRVHARVLGMEALGRFKATTTKLLNGSNAYVYSMSVPAGQFTVEYTCITAPTNAKVIWAFKVRTTKADGTIDWGRWKACSPPESLKGFGSVAPREPSEKQMGWWTRAAARCGLEPEQEVNRKSFQALPVLMDTGERL